MRKKYNFLFYFFSFLWLIAMFFSISDFSFAAELNISYPTLSTGDTITSQTSVPGYFKYVFNFGIFIGFFAVFLSLVWAGVLYLMSPAKPDLLASAKDRVSSSISGLLILVTAYLIIVTINPALSVFKTTELKELPPPNPIPKQPGVYLYNRSDCPVFENGSENYSFFDTTSAPDLGSSAKQISSAKIIHDWQYSVHYISILFENPKFWGMCKYIDPNKECEDNIPQFASSASIYEYNYTPNSGSITFYRKPFFDDSGGFFMVPGQETENIYIRELKELTFEEVPKKEQECTKWDEKGFCINKKPQNLSERNISSIKIDGDYLVLLVYFDKEKPDPDYGPWSSCQAFGTYGDKDKDGPREIKWENIRNLNSKNLPNYVIIFPIKNKN